MIPKFTDRGGTFLFEWQEEMVACEVSRIREHRDGRIVCELTVTTNNPDYDPHLIQDNFNLSSSRSRKELAKELQNRYKEKVEWDSLLEQLSVLTLKKFRQGEPVQEIWGGLESNQRTEQDFLLEPVVYKDEPNMLFGEGKVGKSYLALLFAICVQLPFANNPFDLVTEKESMRVLYLDYETNQHDLEMRLHGLIVGLSLPPVSIMYRRCTMPFADDLEYIRSIVKEHNIGFLVIDSVGGASGNLDLKEAQAANSLFNALRHLKVTSLLIHHTSKNSEDGKARTPFGTVYFINQSRSIWEVRKQQEIGEDNLSIGMFHRYNNLGKLMSPLGFKINFADGATCIERQDAKGVASFGNEIPLHLTIREILSEGPMRIKDIAEELGKSEDVVRVTLKRHPELFRKANGHEWGLIKSEAML